jgi:hypothetical protein
MVVGSNLTALENNLLLALPAADVAPPPAGMQHCTLSFGVFSAKLVTGLQGLINRAHNVGQALQ